MVRPAAYPGPAATRARVCRAHVVTRGTRRRTLPACVQRLMRAILLTPHQVRSRNGAWLPGTRLVTTPARCVCMNRVQRRVWPQPLGHSYAAASTWYEHHTTLHATHLVTWRVCSCPTVFRRRTTSQRGHRGSMRRGRSPGVPASRSTPSGCSGDRGAGRLLVRRSRRSKASTRRLGGWSHACMCVRAHAWGRLLRWPGLRAQAR